MVFDLFSSSPECIPQLEALIHTPDKIELNDVEIFSPKLAKSILQDCVAVAIADADFHPQEKQMIQQIGQSMHVPIKEIQDSVHWGLEQVAHIFHFSG